jgi:ATP-dependent Clp protease adaptor protein ClpS
MSPVVEAEPEAGVGAELAPESRVVIHNDDVTPMDFVVEILVSEFARERADAVRIMFEAHETGAAHVMTCGREEARLRIDRAHSRARARSFPLTFTDEPEV